MTYGTIHTSTKEYVLRRASESGVSTETLGLDFELPAVDDDDESWPEIPDNTYTVAVIVGGALDEEFTIATDYEVNIADWIAEQIQQEAPDEDFEVIVSEFAWDDAGAVRYVTRSDGSYS